MGMSLYKAAGILVLGMAATGLALAQPDIRPGLWEMQMESMTGMGGGVDMAQMQKAIAQMKEQLASMPPEQRKMMEKHMANAGGVAMGDKGFRTCLTKEDIMQNEIPVSENGCDYKIKEQSSKRMIANIQCSNPAVVGTVTATFDTPKSYTISVKGEKADGGKKQPYAMSVRWQHVSDNCGNVKPIKRHP